MTQCNPEPDEESSGIERVEACAEAPSNDDSFEAWETVSRKKRTRGPAAQPQVDPPGCGQAEPSRAYSAVPSGRPAAAPSSPAAGSSEVPATIAGEPSSTVETSAPRYLLPATPQLQGALPLPRGAQRAAQRPEAGAAQAAVSTPWQTNSSTVGDRKSVPADHRASSSNSTATTVSSATSAVSASSNAHYPAGPTTRRPWEPLAGKSSKVLSDWQRNGLSDERAEWLLSSPEAICDRTTGCGGEATVAFRASVKRTFLDVAPVYTAAQRMRPRARSLDTRLSDICVH